MGEFVEQSLEGLVPVFEQLQAVEILSPEEVTGLIKRCRRYEYRLQKREKSPKDFHMYGDYLADVVTLVRSRRKRLDYWHKKDLIDKQLLLKVASIYRRCCDRFQGNLDLWKKMFKFLDENRLHKQLSRAYTRVLQIHGRDKELRIEAALWEFFSNASAENARTQLQLAIRMSPEEYRFYEALFKVEVHFVDKIMQRRKFLQDAAKKAKENKDEDEESDVGDSVFDVDVDDAVLQLRVPEIVMSTALHSVPADKAGEMLLGMWSSLKECTNVTSDASTRVLGEIEAKLTEMKNEETQLLGVRKAILAKEDEFDAYETAVEQLPTERMHRIFLGYCNERLQKDEQDTLAEMKKAELLAKMLEHGWANEKELNTIASSLSDVVSMGEKKKLLEQAVESNSGSVIFWEALLKHRLDNDSFDSEEYVKAFLTQLNTAFDKVPADDSYPLWELALEFAIAHTPYQVEKVFSRAFLNAPTAVASRVKIVRLGYLGALVAEEKLSVEEKRRHVMDMLDSKPNSAQFYLAVAEQEGELAKKALSFSVNENGTSSVESWIAFIRYSLKNEPATVGQLHQRAMMQLDSELCSEFIAEWTALQQEEAAVSLAKEKLLQKRLAEETVVSSAKKPKKEKN